MKEHPRTVATQICHRDVCTGLVCLSSLQRRVGNCAKIQMYDDGSLTNEDRVILTDCLPNSQIILRTERDEVVDEALAKYPHCRRFRHESKFATKGIDIPLTSIDEITYCDSDIYFFRSSPSFLNRTQYGSEAVFMEDIHETYNLRPWHLLGRDSVKLGSRICAGFILMRRTAYDLDLIEWVLGKYAAAFRKSPWVTEQVLWAAHAAQVRSSTVDRSQLAIIRPGERINPRLIAGHFVSTYRHALHSYSDQWEKVEEVASDEPSGVPVIRCTALRLLIDRLRTRISPS